MDCRCLMVARFAIERAVVRTIKLFAARYV